MYFLCEGIPDIKLGLDWIVSGNFLFFIVAIPSLKQWQLQLLCFFFFWYRHHVQIQPIWEECIRLQGNVIEAQV